MAEIGNYDVTSRLPYKLMLSCPSGLLPSQVSVIFDKLYDRIPHPDFDLEKSIDQIWDQRAQQNSSLYNGKKFRYGGHAFHSTGGVDCKSNCYLNLHLGLTDYRTFMGTNLNPLWEKFLVQSEDETIRCQHTSNPLGNGGIVETSDGKILVLKRSNNVGEFPGHFVFPGGHPEPEEVGIISHDNLDPESLSRRVSMEMFDSIVREVVEETGVPAISLSNPVFIGISRRELNVRPTAFFFMKCSLQSKDIEKLYSSAQDGFESTQLCTISKDELESVAWKMPGCHHGGLALYKLMEDAKQN
ncbi:nudix hydrolase 9-like isoform X1 [Chenopodium quinoa]|uniref:nudix hydrolase 9-like isoform X1 n=1 Tax=Chenopodium quinoa TaxID=63459 RepID=UPI000B78E0A7|nr:nudix hydrolase 9-like isoform X1 [Chenopodium quinoa]